VEPQSKSWARSPKIFEAYLCKAAGDAVKCLHRLRVMNNTLDIDHMLAPFQALPRTLAGGKAIA